MKYEVEYDDNGNSWCKTPCPFNMKEGDDIIHIGSIGCRMCSNHVLQDSEKKNVVCRLDTFEEQKDEQKPVDLIITYPPPLKRGNND